MRGSTGVSKHGQTYCLEGEGGEEASDQAYQAEDREDRDQAYQADRGDAPDCAHCAVGGVMHAYQAYRADGEFEAAMDKTKPLPSRIERPANDQKLDSAPCLVYRCKKGPLMLRSPTNR